MYYLKARRKGCCNHKTLEPKKLLLLLLLEKLHLNPTDDITNILGARRLKLHRIILVCVTASFPEHIDIKNKE